MITFIRWKCLLPSINTHRRNISYYHTFPRKYVFKIESISKLFKTSEFFLELSSHSFGVTVCQQVTKTTQSEAMAKGGELLSKGVVRQREGYGQPVSECLGNNSGFISNPSSLLVHTLPSWRVPGSWLGLIQLKLLSIFGE